MSWIFSVNDRIHIWDVNNHTNSGIVKDSGNMGWFSIKCDRSGQEEYFNLRNVVSIRVLEKAKHEELDTDIENEIPEPETPRNPLIDKALSLAELKKERDKEQREGIKDHLTNEDVKPVESHYAMPSFKKHTED